MRRAPAWQWRGRDPRRPRSTDGEQPEQADSHARTPRPRLHRRGALPSPYCSSAMPLQHRADIVAAARSKTPGILSSWPATQARLERPLDRLDVVTLDHVAFLDVLIVGK